MTIIRTGRAAISVAASTLLLAACGGQAAVGDEFLEQSPRAITRTAFAEMSDVSSVRILGTLGSAGRRARIDVRTADDGGCTGSVELDHGSARFIHNAEGTWLKADDDFWRATAQTPQQARQIVARLGTSWTVAPDQALDLGRFCNTKPMLNGFKARKDGGEGRLSKGGVELIGETRAIAISEKGGGQSSTVWVSVTAPHRVVKLASHEGGSPISISFEEFGVEVDSEAPAEDDVVDLSAYAPKTSGKN